MGEIPYDQGTGVESFVCTYADAVAADSRRPVYAAGCVYAEVDLVILGSEEA